MNGTANYSENETSSDNKKNDSVTDEHNLAKMDASGIKQSKQQEDRRSCKEGLDSGIDLDAIQFPHNGGIS